MRDFWFVLCGAWPSPDNYVLPASISSQLFYKPYPFVILPIITEAQAHPMRYFACYRGLPTTWPVW